MSESAAKRHPIDLDEFERGLRAPAQPNRNGPEDPLAELARLVGGGPDPFASMFAAARDERRGPADPQPPQGPGADPNLRAGHDQRPSWRQAGPSSANAAAIEAAVEAERALYAGQGQQQWDQPAEDWQAPPRTRSRKSLLLMSAALLLVLGGIGATFALRGHGLRFGPPPTILAAAGPFKVRPPKAPPRDPIELSSSFLNQPATSVVPPAHVVNSEEEPVALSQLAKGAAAEPQDGGSNASFFPKPRLVKTVTVRPDGSIIPDGAGADAAASLLQSDAPGAPQSASPPQAAPASSQPEAQTPPTPAPAASAAAAAPAAASPVGRSRAPATHSAFADVARLAAGEPTRPPTRAPASAAPRAQVKPEAAAPSQEAPAAAPPSPASAGGWAVQLAAPGTERAAQIEAKRMSAKYAAALGGRTVAYFSAKAHGRTFWRVRVAGLAEGQAIGLCKKIKGVGGVCFVARN